MDKLIAVIVNLTAVARNFEDLSRYKYQYGMIEYHIELHLDVILETSANLNLTALTARQRENFHWRGAWRGKTATSWC